MKFALVQITGQNRGDTRYFDRSRLSLGSAPDNDLVFSGNGPQATIPAYVELLEIDCEIHLHNHDPSVTTLVNHNPLVEATLHNQDIIQLGPEGPKLRFRIRSEEYAACKRSSEILRDALDVASEARTDGMGTVRSFFYQLAYDVRRNATRPTQIVVATLFVLLVGSFVGLAYYSYTEQQAQEHRIATLLRELESTRVVQQADLENRLRGERERMAEALTTRQAEMERLVSMLEEQQQQGRGASPQEVDVLTRRLKILETEHRSAEVLIRQYGPSVCFLYGAYGFLEKNQSTGDPATLFEYTGTGFLIDEEGLIVTNRHLVEPWSMDPSGAEVVKSGFQPKLVTLVAYFPGSPQPYHVSVAQVSDEGDVSVGQLAPIPQGISPISLQTPAPQAAVGEGVVVLGYPVGVEGVLARMEHKAADALLQKAHHQLQQLVHDIANQGGVRPLATQGHIGDIVPGRLVYDAQTTGGASGSPVFNSRGELIGVNAAFMKRFGGASFGVPITMVHSLLPSSK